MKIHFYNLFKLFFLEAPPSLSEAKAAFFPVIVSAAPFSLLLLLVVVLLLILLLILLEITDEAVLSLLPPSSWLEFSVDACSVELSLCNGGEEVEEDEEEVEEDEEEDKVPVEEDNGAGIEAEEEEDVDNVFFGIAWIDVISLAFLAYSS
jgi:hypothetical protein